MYGMIQGDTSALDENARCNVLLLKSLQEARVSCGKCVEFFGQPLRIDGGYVDGKVLQL
jgi:hypothetical protein